MLLDVNLTMDFLLKSNFLEEFFSTLFDSWRSFKLSYERKLFALAISNLIFNCVKIPTEIRDKTGFFL